MRRGVDKRYNYPSISFRVQRTYGDESTTTIFQRLIRANKISMCGVSAFCTYPVLANENGLAFLYKFPNHQNEWATNLSRTHMNVREWEAPLLGSTYVCCDAYLTLKSIGATTTSFHPWRSCWTTFIWQVLVATKIKGSTACVCSNLFTRYILTKSLDGMVYLLFLITINVSRKLVIITRCENKKEVSKASDFYTMQIKKEWLQCRPATDADHGRMSPALKP